MTPALSPDLRAFPASLLQPLQPLHNPPAQSIHRTRPLILRRQFRPRPSTKMVPRQQPPVFLIPVPLGSFFHRPRISREAAKDCSPRRKPWVSRRQGNQPRRGEREAAGSLAKTAGTRDSYQGIASPPAFRTVMRELSFHAGEVAAEVLDRWACAPKAKANNTNKTMAAKALRRISSYRASRLSLRRAPGAPFLASFARSGIYPISQTDSCACIYARRMALMRVW